MKFKSEVQLEALNNATTDTNKFLVSDGSTVKYRTGAQLLADIGGSVGGITSLNGLTASIQILAPGNEGTDFDIISNGDQHLFNLPDASLINRGVVTIGAQGFAGAKTFYEDLIVNGLTIGEGGAIGNTAINNTAIGISALTLNTANNNTAIGYVTLANNVVGFQNTAIGSYALYANIGGLNPAYPGDPVQYFGVYNTAIGFEALRNNQGNNNTAIGIRTLVNNTTGYQNTAIGSETLSLNTIGQENTAVGKDALRNNSSANWNTAVGSSALQNNTIGYQNTAVGRFASLSNSGGSYNTSIGVDSLTANISSNLNTGVGYKAGYTVTGARNTFLGSQDDNIISPQLAIVNDSIAIGHGAYTTRNFQVVLGNEFIGETLLRGDIKLTTSPTTSPGSYQILTINTVGGPNTGRIESIPSSSLNFLPLVGGNMTGNINWLAQNANGLNWTNDTDSASIKFYSTGDADPNTRLEFNITDNNTEYFRWTTTPASVLYELMRLAPTALGSGNAILTVSGKVIANSFEKSGGNNNQILAAGGGIITAGTNITISGGTISSTGGSTLSMGSISATANANGATITGSVLNLAAATNTTGGVITTGIQTFAGSKTFSSIAYFQGINVDNGGSNNGIALINNGAVTGINMSNTDTGKGIVINNTTPATGMPFTVQKNQVDKFTVTDAGVVTAAGGFFNSSDTRLKDIIEQDGDTVKFTWKDKQDDKIHIGYIAQELQEKYPDQVSEDTNGMLTVNYIEVLVAKIQELENRIKQLEK